MFALWAYPVSFRGTSLGYFYILLTFDDAGL
jgi:hypothetical protein